MQAMSNAPNTGTGTNDSSSNKIGRNNMSLSEQLPDGWIDLFHGEAEVVRDAFLEQFQMPKLSFGNRSFNRAEGSVNYGASYSLGYPHPSGYQPLVATLEKKHGNNKVIITNGAKQALAAIFYALRKTNHYHLGFVKPTWSMIKPLAEMYGLTCVDSAYDCYISINPNNPDGSVMNLDYAQALCNALKKKNIPFIHDAAYYNPVYLPENYEYGPYGDVRIFSISKAFGLSGLRLGYMVFRDETLYKAAQEYIETTTVGVSVLNQIYLADLLREMELNPNKEKLFITNARNALYKARFICRTINKDILELPKDFDNSNSMFLFAKLLKKDAFTKAKLKVGYESDVGSFKGDIYVRINLAANFDKLVEGINRLNKVV